MKQAGRPSVVLGFVFSRLFPEGVAVGERVPVHANRRRLGADLRGKGRRGGGQGVLHGLEATRSVARDRKGSPCDLALAA